MEYLTLTLKSYQYRGLIQSDVNILIKYFKEHFREPPPHPSCDAWISTVYSYSILNNVYNTVGNDMVV